MWYVAMTPEKTAIVNGTFVGYIMVSTIIILGLVMDAPLDRRLVSIG
jgi:Ca2+/H+ antiporter